MVVQTHSGTLKPHAFGLQSLALIEGRLSGQDNPSAGRQHTMPWQAEAGVSLAQRPPHEAGIARRTQSSGDIPIGRHPPGGNFGYKPPNGFLAAF